MSIFATPLGIAGIGDCDIVRAAASYVKEGFSNIRIGMFLEIATTFGALLGAFLATRIPTAALAIIFGAVLVYSAYVSRKPRPLAERESAAGSAGDEFAAEWHFSGWTRGAARVQRAECSHGLQLDVLGAGALSGLLGIGSGAVKVLAMDQAMRIPFKVSTTTSNFMIGVTAAASAAVYLSRGYVDPGLSMPVMLGVLAGSLLGSRILVKAETKSLRLVFSVVILVLGLQMLYKGITGHI